MAFDPILRLVKGSELTWQELDDNFSQIDNELILNEAFHSSIDTRVTVLENTPTNLPNASASGQIAYWNPSTQWTAGDHNDILPTGSYQHSLMWDTATSTWTAQPTVDGLPLGANGEILVHDGTTWVAQPANSGGSVLPNGGTVNNVLTWDGANWVSAPAQDSELPLTATAGESLVWNGIGWVADNVLPTTAASGDLLSFDGVNWVAQTPSQSLPTGNTTHQTLQWNGTDWLPTSDIDITGNLTFSGSSGNTGEVLTSQGAGLPPIWSALVSGGGLSVIDETIAQDGWVDLSNGLQLRWGEFESNSDGAETHSFSKPFTNNCFFCTVTPVYGNNNDGAWLTWTNNGFTVNRHDNFSWDTDSFYFAIGN